jgi:hypothetical protein
MWSVCYSTYSLNPPDYSLNTRSSYFDALQGNTQGTFSQTHFMYLIHLVSMRLPEHLYSLDTFLSMFSHFLNHAVSALSNRLKQWFIIANHEQSTRLFN